MKTIKTLLLLSLGILLFSCGNSKETEKIPEIYGEWKNATIPDENGSVIYCYLRLKANGEIQFLAIGGFDVGLSFSGSFEKMDNNQYSFQVKPYYGEDNSNYKTLSGAFSLSVGKDNYLQFTTDIPIDDAYTFATAGEKITFFQDGLAYKTDFRGDEPTVLDVYKMIQAFVFEPGIRDEYNFVINGTVPSEYADESHYKRLIDIENAYIYYATDYPVPVASAYRLWKCKGGENYLFISNHPSSEGYLPTALVMDFFKYNKKNKTIQRVESPYQLQGGEEDAQISFSSTNDDMEVVCLEGVYDENEHFEWKKIASSTLKWNGYTFDEVNYKQ